MDESLILLLWGKTKDRDPKATVYHPLLFHLLDVANAARELWRLLPAPMQKRIARALGVSDAEAERVVILLAGIHDLGKASAFQTKAEFLWQDIKAAGFRFLKPTEELHSFVTAYRDVLPKLLLNTEICGWSVRKPQMANTLAAITGAHHGKFPSLIQSMSSFTLGDEKWSEARAELARLLAEATVDEGETANHIRIDGSLLTDKGVGAFLTGLISVADWIGSASGHFLTDSQSRTIAEYAPLSRIRAHQAMTEFGWLPRPQFCAALPFHEIIWDTDSDDKPVRFAPNDLQKQVAKYAEAADGRPYLLIAEAAMGEGKTEAALYAVDYGLSTDAHAGFYVGLPTQATGNAMFRRVLAYLHHRGHEGRLNLQLVHSNAEFNDDYEGLKDKFKKPLANGPIRDSKNDQRVVAESWFSSRKQALLAPFGVGTIDQSLTGVLQTKHWFVRLFGLAGKIVVFDEVHAYDVYMNELLETLIGWLAELDCTVILLSATLPTARREALMQAYRGDVAVTAAPYPRVTFVPKEGNDSGSETVPGAKESSAVSLSFARAQGEALAARILDDLPDGGCAAIICNTVAQAQTYFAALQSDPVLREKGWSISLFHARMPLDWRLAREKEVVARFGKKSGPTQRDRQILIATQVVEQSLDLDFDWMASEMAPVDLLLQRMGRLWRHVRANRPASKPNFVILAEVGETEDALPVFPPCSDLIYDAYTLLRSFLVIRGKSALVLPGEIETLVGAAYDGEPAPPNAEWETALRAAKDKMQNDQTGAKSQAEGNRVPLEGSDDFQTLFTRLQHNLVDDDNPEVHATMRAVTRLGDPSVTLICLRRDSDGALRPYCAPPDAAPVRLRLDKEDFKIKPPSKEQVRLLRESSLSLSRPKALYYYLLNQPLPENWNENGHLRYARCLIFTDGESKVETNQETILLRLDPATGLSIAREQVLEESQARKSDAIADN